MSLHVSWMSQIRSAHDLVLGFDVGLGWFHGKLHGSSSLIGSGLEGWLLLADQDLHPYWSGGYWSNGYGSCLGLRLFLTGP